MGGPYRYLEKRDKQATKDVGVDRQLPDESSWKALVGGGVAPVTSKHMHTLVTKVLRASRKASSRLYPLAMSGSRGEHSSCAGVCYTVNGTTRRLGLQKRDYREVAYLLTTTYLGFREGAG